MATQKTLVTAEELFRNPALRWYELVRGELRKMTPPGYRHARITSRTHTTVSNFVEEHSLGVVLAEMGFRLEGDPDTVRAPDVAFITKDRMPEGDPVGFLEMAPDLVVEVISPGDTTKEIQEKVQEWLGAGVRLVLLLYPNTRTAVVHHPDGAARVLSESDMLDGEDVLPGFSVTVSALFA